MMPFLFACTPLVFIAFFYHRVRPRERIVAIAVTLIQILTFSALGCILQYLLAREGGESWDQIFLDADRTMGLDWIGYVRWVDAHAWAATALRWGYAAMIPGAIATVISLSLLGKLDELRTFTLAGLICGGVTILLSPLFPSVSCYVFLGLHPADFQHVNVQPGYAQLVDFAALRAGTFSTIRLPELQGIIAFPSYHAGLATVSTWGFWKADIWWIRLLGICTAICTIVSAPVFGGHYFADVIAGIVIASCSIGLAKHLVYTPGLAPWITALPFRHSREASAR